VKIALASGWYFPESLGGTEVYVNALATRLRAAGHKVFVAAPDPASREERSYQHDGTQVYRYPTPSHPTRSECQGVCVVRGAEYFHRWIQDLQPDIVHLHTLTTGLGVFELRAAKRAGARVLVTAHLPSLGWICQRGTMMRWGESLCDGMCQIAKCSACELHHRGIPKTLARLAGHLPVSWSRTASLLPGSIGSAVGMADLIIRNQSMQRECLEIVDHFVVLTDWAMEALARNGAPEHKLALNRLGMCQSVAHSKPGPQIKPTSAPVTIGYLGRFERLKGARELARAVASLDRSLPVRVEFRGPARTDSNRHQMEQVRIAGGGDPRITFAPEVATQDVPNILAGYDVLCCPSLALEGGPTVAIEAHAVGTPVVGSRIGGLAEVISDGVNGRLTPPGDVGALAGVLREISENPRGTVDRWRDALPTARTMDAVAADYLSLYKA